MTPLSGYVLTAAEMRAAELACGVPLHELMERAGAVLAEAIWRFGGGRPTLILCGPGNNGGDGYVAARLLAVRGLEVSVAADGPPQTDLARAAATLWTGEVEKLAEAKPAPVLVDALFGTGLSRPLDPRLTKALHDLAHAGRMVIAADMPSGVGTDDGSDLGAVQADITIAFGAAKPAHLLQPAAALSGVVLAADIGIEASSSVNVLARPALPAPEPADHKYTRGYVFVIGGSMPGAASLAATAAARSGAGYVALAADVQSVPNAIVGYPCDAAADVLGDTRIDAIVVGPGFGADGDDLLDAVLASHHALVLDGSALRSVPAPRAERTILTPHVGEFDRMFGKGDGSKLERTRDAAERAHCTVIFKGADTVIASPGGRVTLAPAASSWLSTAGTGDVLAGIAGAMLARGLGAHDAACAAVWLHGEAARRAGPGFIADDLAAHFPAVLAACQ